MDPNVNRGKSQEGLETCGDALPADDQAPVFLLKPGNGPLGWEPWHHLCAGPPPIFLGLPDALRDLGPAPPLPELLAPRFRRIACLRGDDAPPVAGAAPLARAALDGITHRQHVGPLRPHGPAWYGWPGAGHRPPCACGAASLCLSRRGRRPRRPPSQGETAPSTAPYSPHIMPRSAALPSIRAGIAATGPSACPRCTQRCGALFDPHGGPGGTSHQRQPVSKMSNKVCRIFRNGAWGLPRLRCGGAGGKPSSHKRHSTSLTPANRPAILPSYVQIEQSSTKIILVGYIHRSGVIKDEYRPCRVDGEVSGGW